MRKNLPYGGFVQVNGVDIRPSHAYISSSLYSSRERKNFERYLLLPDKSLVDAMQLGGLYLSNVQLLMSMSLDARCIFKRGKGYQLTVAGQCKRRSIVKYLHPGLQRSNNSSAKPLQAQTQQSLSGLTLKMTIRAVHSGLCKENTMTTAPLAQLGGPKKI